MQGTSVDLVVLRRQVNQQKQAARLTQKAGTEMQRRLDELRAEAPLTLARAAARRHDPHHDGHPAAAGSNRVLGTGQIRARTVEADELLPSVQPAGSTRLGAATATIAIVASTAVIAALLWRTGATSSPNEATPPPPATWQPEASRDQPDQPIRPPPAKEDFEESYDRLGRALSDIPRSRAEEVLRAPGCGVAWHNGQPALQYGQESSKAGLAKSISKCSEAVERLASRLSGH